MTEENKIKSIEDFNKWLNKHCKKGMVYRGLQDSEAHLSASLYRRLEISNLPKDTQGFIKATRELIEKATKEGHHQEGGMKMTDLNLLAKLQHIGAATCLIDFTNNPLVALWFACQPITKHQPNKKPDERPDEKLDIDRKVVALNPENPENLEKFKIVKSKNFEEKIEFFLNKEQLWVWPPPKQNSRVIAQQSVFILGQGIIEKKEIDKTCIIAKEARGSILEELEKHGISENSLFCDFTGFAQQNAWYKSYQDLAPTIALDDYLRNAVSAYQSNDFDKAIKYCNKAIGIDSENIRAHHIRGVAKRRKKDYGGAIADLNKVTQIDPQHKYAYYSRGVAKMLKGDDYEGAIADFDKVIKEINPQHYDAYWLRGDAKAELGDYDSAILDYDDAININPQCAQAYYKRSLYNYHIGNYEGAVEDYYMAKDIAPDDPDIIPHEMLTAYKYYFRVGMRIVHAGITTDLGRMQAEHTQRRLDWKDGRIEQVGYITTIEAAWKWEKIQQKKGMPSAYNPHYQ